MRCSFIPEELERVGVSGEVNEDDSEGGKEIEEEPDSPKFALLLVLVVWEWESGSVLTKPALVVK
jgi:hypothetical protein